MSDSCVPFLGAIEDVSGGNQKVPQSEFLPVGELPVVDQGQSLIAGYTNELAAAVRTPGPVIVFGDHTRALKYVDFPFAMGADGVKILRPREGFDPKFAYHYLRSRNIPSAGYSRHYKFLKEVSVPKPDLAEQRRIVAVLDRAETLRAKRHQVIALLDALTQSVFHDMFAGKDLPREPLKDLCIVAGEYGANVPSVDPRSELPRYVRITDIAASGVLHQEARAPGGTPADWDRYRLKDGDLVFARSGATVGKTYRYRETDGPCVFAGYLIRFRPDPNVLDPDYLFAFTQTVEYGAWVRSKQNAVAQPNINAKQYGSELTIPLPTIELQRQFACRASAIRERRRVLEQALTKDNELFASLQDRAFRGEL